MNKGEQVAYSLKIATTPNLRTQVVSKLREAIAQGHLAPGQRLTEKSLCEMTGVSRTSIREALRELETEGLVTSQPNRGMIVCEIDPHLVQSTFEVRGSLELLAVTLFVRSADALQMARLRAAMDTLSNALDKRDPTETYHAKVGFYDAILIGAGNPMLAQMLRGIHVRVAQLRVASLSNPARSAHSKAEFTELYNAIAARDLVRAKKACRSHIENARVAALTALDAAKTTAIAI